MIDLIQVITNENDEVIVSREENELEKATLKVKKRKGLRINEEKSNYMCCSREERIKSNFVYGRHPLF